MTDFLREILSICLAASCIIALLLVLRPALGKFCAPRFRCIIWLAIALRLMVPVQLSLGGESAVAVPLPQDAGRVLYARGAPVQQVNQPVQPQNQPITEPAAVQPPLAEPTTDLAPVSQAQSQKGIVITLEDALFALWLLGAVGYLGWQGILSLRFHRYCKRWARPVEDLALLQNLTDELGIKKRVSMEICPGIGTPVLVGLRRPTVLLPESCPALDLVLRHELTHLKRKDLGAKLLFLAVTALHWWNPLVHFLVRAAHEDIELACDEAVTKSLDETGRSDYAHAILLAMEKPQLVSPVSTAFSGGLPAVKRRLHGIVKPLGEKGRSILALSLVLTIFAGSLVSCTAPIGTMKATVNGDNMNAMVGLSNLKPYTPPQFEMVQIQESDIYDLISIHYDEYGERQQQVNTGFFFYREENLDKYSGYKDDEGNLYRLAKADVTLPLTAQAGGTGSSWYDEKNRRGEFSYATGNGLERAADSYYVDENGKPQMFLRSYAPDDTLWGAADKENLPIISQRLDGPIEMFLWLDDALYCVDLSTAVKNCWPDVTLVKVVGANLFPEWGGYYTLDGSDEIQHMRIWHEGNTLRFQRTVNQIDLLDQSARSQVEAYYKDFGVWLWQEMELIWFSVIRQDTLDTGETVAVCEGAAYVYSDAEEEPRIIPLTSLFFQIEKDGSWHPLPTEIGWSSREEWEDDEFFEKAARNAIWGVWDLEYTVQHDDYPGYYGLTGPDFGICQPDDAIRESLGNWESQSTWGEESTGMEFDGNSTRVSWEGVSYEVREATDGDTWIFENGIGALSITDPKYSTYRGARVGMAKSEVKVLHPGARKPPPGEGGTGDELWWNVSFEDNIDVPWDGYWVDRKIIFHFENEILIEIVMDSEHGEYELVPHS